MDENVTQPATTTESVATQEPETTSGEPQQSVEEQTQEEEKQPVSTETDNSQEDKEPEIKTTDDAFTKAVSDSIQKHQERSKSNVSESQDDGDNGDSISQSDQAVSSDEDKGNKDKLSGDQSNNTTGQDNKNGETQQTYTRADLKAETEQISAWIDQQSHTEAIQKLGDLGQFIDENGKGALTIWDIQQKAENGETIFLNPFDKDQPFDNMEDAKKNLDYFNDYLETQYRKAAKESKTIWTERYKPNLRMKAFAPRFNQMSKLAQQMFMERAGNQNAFVLNDKGKFVGFKNDFDLDATANEIEKMIERVNQGEKKDEDKEEDTVQATEPVAKTPTANAEPVKEEIKKPGNYSEAFANAMLADIKKRQGGK